MPRLTLAEAVMLAAIIVCFAFVTSKPKAQTPTKDQLFDNRIPAHLLEDHSCDNAQAQIQKIYGDARFKQPRVIHGEEARYWTDKVFGMLRADHAIVFPMTDGGTIILPCRAHRTWDNNDTQRIEIDALYQKRLRNPKTEMLVQPEEQPKRRGTR
jgi:hypothetical protein